MEKLPRITCLCVSQNRPEFLKQAIYYFRNQTYLNKDLLIVYGGDNKIWEEISLHDENIKVINIGQTTALGAGLLRNIALENCEGDYFCLWDDDDWYHSQRLELQLKSLLSSGRPANMLDRLLLYDSLKHQAYLSSKRYWEGSLLCKTDVVKGNFQFPNERGGDTDFISQLVSRDYVYAISSPYLYAYIFHGRNTWETDHFRQLFNAGYKLNAESELTVKKTLTREYDYHEGSAKILKLKLEVPKLI